jgi:hypothetical protein
MPSRNIPLARHGEIRKREGAWVAFFRETQIVDVPLPFLP